jgi:glucose/mannose transport system substrate-binding protein
LAGNAPEVIQIIGVSIGEWAEMGLLLELDGVATAGNWSKALFPSIHDLIQHRRHVFAAPLGIHRINTFFYNRRLFSRYKLPPPETWTDLERAALRFKAGGITALAQSSEPWQVATLFEDLILLEGGPQLHRDLFTGQTASAADDRRVLVALERLRAMKAWMGPSITERPWTEVVRQLAKGEAAMLVMGDWAKGELAARGDASDDECICVPMPGTAKYHLYSVDTLTMFTGDASRAPAQEKLARLIMTPTMQMEYNAIKGSVPVRRDIDSSKMDDCARASWAAFGRGASVQAPSLVHRMATDEGSRDAIIAEIHRYFVDDSETPAEAQRRLSAVFRALHLRSGK